MSEVEYPTLSQVTKALERVGAFRFSVFDSNSPRTKEEAPVDPGCFFLRIDPKAALFFQSQAEALSALKRIHTGLRAIACSNTQHRRKISIEHLLGLARLPTAPNAATVSRVLGEVAEEWEFFHSNIFVVQDRIVAAGPFISPKFSGDGTKSSGLVEALNLVLAQETRLSINTYFHTDLINSLVEKLGLTNDSLQR